MKRAILIALLMLVCGALIAVAMKYDSGYVRLSYGNYLVESSIWIALLALLAAFALLVIALRLIGLLVATLLGRTHWMSNLSHNRAQRKTTKGLLSYAEGNWKKA